jgi:hypothetical protein
VKSSDGERCFGCKLFRKRKRHNDLLTKWRVNWGKTADEATKARRFQRRWHGGDMVVTALSRLRNPVCSLFMNTDLDHTVYTLAEKCDTAEREVQQHMVWVLGYALAMARNIKGIDMDQEFAAWWNLREVLSNLPFLDPDLRQRSRWQGLRMAGILLEVLQKHLLRLFTVDDSEYKTQAPPLDYMECQHIKNIIWIFGKALIANRVRTQIRYEISVWKNLWETLEDLTSSFWEWEDIPLHEQVGWAAYFA